MVSLDSAVFVAVARFGLIGRLGYSVYAYLCVIVYIVRGQTFVMQCDYFSVLITLGDSNSFCHYLTKTRFSFI